MELRYQLRYHRLAMLCRCRASAPPRGPAHTPAAPEPPVSMLAGLFVSTTMAMPFRASLNCCRNGCWLNAMQHPCRSWSRLGQVHIPCMHSAQLWLFDGMHTNLKQCSTECDWESEQGMQLQLEWWLGLWVSLRLGFCLGGHSADCRCACVFAYSNPCCERFQVWRPLI